jgi:hypothetical protein
MRDMYQASLSDTVWQFFVNRQDVSYDSERDMYVIDPLNYNEGN